MYVAGYALGRFFVERMRIDFAHTIAGLRVNEWISVVAFLVAIGFVATGRFRRRLDHSPDEAEQPSWSRSEQEHGADNDQRDAV